MPSVTAVTLPSSSAYLAVDEDLATFTLIQAEEDGSPPSFSYQISHPEGGVFISEVVVNLIFREDWFYFPDHICLITQSAYQVCLYI